MSASKLRLSQVPREYQEKMFYNLIKHRGVKAAEQLIVEDATLSCSFQWCNSKEGYKFWQAINNGYNPPMDVTMTSELESVVAEAESRGFKVGVQTKYGCICDTTIAHELLPDGSFFYRNIQVRNSKGKWIKPNVTTSNKPDNKSDFLAIHALLTEILSIRSN